MFHASFNLGVSLERNHNSKDPTQVLLKTQDTSKRLTKLVQGLRATGHPMKRWSESSSSDSHSGHLSSSSKLITPLLLSSILVKTLPFKMHQTKIWTLGGEVLFQAKLVVISSVGCCYNIKSTNALTEKLPEESPIHTSTSASLGSFTIIHNQWYLKVNPHV